MRTQTLKMELGHSKFRNTKPQEIPRWCFFRWERVRDGAGAKNRRERPKLVDRVRRSASLRCMDFSRTGAAGAPQSPATGRRSMEAKTS